MTSAPFHIKGADWGLTVNQEAPEVFCALASAQSNTLNLPGLRYNHYSNRVEGMLDAVAAASRLLGTSLPPYLKPQTLHTFRAALGLRPYQLQGAQQLRGILNYCSSAILADEMGLGKSRQAIVTALSFNPRCVVIACPASVRETWREELLACGEKDCDIAVAGPLPAYRMDWWIPLGLGPIKGSLVSRAKWVITSYDLLAKAHSVLAQVPDFLIIDEGQLLRGRDSVRSKAVQELAAVTTYRLLLSGTPAWDRPRDFYRLLNILFGRKFGSSYDFDVRYCGGTPGAHGGLDNTRVSNPEELKLRLSYYMVRREKAEVSAELPTLQRQVLWCDPDATAVRAYQTAILRKQPGDYAAALRATAEAKMPEALRLAAEAKRFLLFTHLKEHAKKLHHALCTSGTDCVLITGEVPIQKRNQLAAQAAAKGIGIVATLDSLSVGVNLQRVASIGIMHTLDFVPMKMLQGEKRLDRIGQESQVLWYYLACRDTMDAPIAKEIVSKLDALKSILGTSGGVEAMRDALAQTEGVDANALRSAYDSLPDNAVVDDEYGSL